MFRPCQMPTPTSESELGLSDCRSKIRPGAQQCLGPLNSLRLIHIGKLNCHCHSRQGSVGSKCGRVLMNLADRTMDTRSTCVHDVQGASEENFDDRASTCPPYRQL